jgi:hypothetical protein
MQFNVIPRIMAVSIAMREASERLMKEMENDKSSKIMFK